MFNSEFKLFEVSILIEYLFYLIKPVEFDKFE
jgi:hypothetical protein